MIGDDLYNFDLGLLHHQDDTIEVGPEPPTVSIMPVHQI